MKSVAAVLTAVAMLAAPCAVLAQEEIVGASPSSRKQLDLYEPNANQPTRQIDIGELAFPMLARQAKPGFVSLQVQDKEYWVRRMQVRVKRQSKAECPPLARGLVQTNSTPGAGAVGCR